MNCLTDAFKQLDCLNEDVFEVTSDGLKELDSFKEDDKADDTVEVIDIDAADEDDLEDSYIGKVICQCEVCKSIIFFDKDTLDVSDEFEVVNESEECPYCFSTSGFKVVGEVTPFKEYKVSATDEDGNDIDVELSVNGVDIDTAEEKNSEDEDDDLEEGCHKLSEAKSKSLSKDISDSKSSTSRILKDTMEEWSSMTSVKDIADFVESQFEQAGISTDGSKTILARLRRSRNTMDAINTLTNSMLSGMGLSMTRGTSRSKNESMTRRRLDRRFVKYNESLDSIKLDDGTQEIEIKTKEKEFEPSDETIMPPSDKTIEDIVDVEDMTDDYDVPEDGDEVEADVEGIDEESFDDLAESYLKKTYGNIKSYNTVKGYSSDNKFKLEGVIKFKSGKSKKTSFMFEASTVNSKGKLKFIGENKDIARGKKPFMLHGSLKNKNFLPESFTYNYRARLSEGKSTKVYGTIKLAECLSKRG